MSKFRPFKVLNWRLKPRKAPAPPPPAPVGSGPPLLAGRDFWDDLWVLSRRPVPWYNFLAGIGLHKASIQTTPSLPVVAQVIMERSRVLDVQAETGRRASVLWLAVFVVTPLALALALDDAVPAALASICACVGFYLGRWFEYDGVRYRADLHRYVKAELANSEDGEGYEA